MQKDLFVMKHSLASDLHCDNDIDLCAPGAPLFLYSWCPLPLVPLVPPPYLFCKPPPPPFQPICHRRHGAKSPEPIINIIELPQL
jgi:hypothetical protein